MLTRHLNEVGETYFQHFRHAAGFAATMMLAGMACMIHAVLPFLFERTGSNCIRCLHERMVLNRANLTRYRPPESVDSITRQPYLNP